MFLKKTTYKNGKTFLSIVESYRDDDGKSKHRVIKKIGYLDDFLDQYDDPIAYFSQMAIDMTKDANEYIHVSLDIDMNSHIDSGYNFYNVGYFPYKYIYLELGLNEFFINKQRTLNIEYSLSKNC